MSREVKLGMLTFITLFAAVWGYRFIKGQNLFQPSRTYLCSFNDVTGLAVSSDVTVNGYKIGTARSEGSCAVEAHTLARPYRRLAGEPRPARHRGAVARAAAQPRLIRAAKWKGPFRVGTALRDLRRWAS